MFYFLDDAPFLMVVRDTVIFGIPLDISDSTNNAMAPVSGISQGRDIDFDDQEQFVYWVQSTVSCILNVRIFLCVPIVVVFDRAFELFTALSNSRTHRNFPMRRMRFCSGGRLSALHM